MPLLSEEDQAANASEPEVLPDRDEPEGTNDDGDGQKVHRPEDRDVLEEEDDDDEVEDDLDHDKHEQAGVDRAIEEQHSPERREYKKRRAASGAERKAPGAPKRFKSSYICFFMAQQTEIKEELGDKATVALISKRSAEKWKALTVEERAHWENVAAQDKQRYIAEKSTYTGPWKVPWKRARKDPSAPKRPMSAFLMFAQGRRAEIRKKKPDLKNTEVSQILGEMWRNMSEVERRPFVEKEMADREVYKVKSAEWKEESEARAEAERRQARAEVPMFLAPVDPGMHGLVHPYYQPPFPSVLPYPYHAAYPPPPPSFPLPPGKQPVVLAPSGLPRIPMVPYMQPFAGAMAQPLNRPTGTDANRYSPTQYFDVEHSGDAYAAFDPNAVVDGEDQSTD